MAVGAYKYYAGLPTWARGVVLIALGVIIIIIIFWIMKLLKDAKEKNKQKERDQEYIQDFKQYCGGKANVGQSSYPATSYIQMANDIFQAGCAEDYVTCGGTDEDAIKAVFQKMNTTCDVIQLVQAFGKRVKRTEDLNTVLGGFLGSINPFSDYTAPKYELGAWLQTELDSSEMESIVNAVLKSKGINYQF